ncbi:MAG: ATP-binding protein [Candidatus Brennerbacteria bacterium]|nr:ATP-binding protein [Candidatus Brennerbacteria bacterium]
MFEKFIVEQNKHWKEEPIDTGFSRVVMADIVKYLDIKQIVALIGVRRSGKSTIARQLVKFLIKEKGVNPKNILFLNLESPLLNQFKSDPGNLQKIFDEYLDLVEPKGKIFIFLDEAQFFSDWQVFVKSLYERGGVKFFITGSNSRLLSAEMATLLSGRSIAKSIYPFNFREMAGVRKIEIKDRIEIIRNERRLKKVFGEYLKDGGFPEIFLEKKKEIKKEILANYYKNILYQDIVPRFEIKKTKEIENLLLYLFSNIGQRYSYNSLAKFLKMNDKTVKEYIGFFEKSFLLFELSNYQYSVKKQENYPKKVYAIDNGFIGAVSFSFSENYGHFLENTVFLGLLGTGKEIYYHLGKYECDFVVKEGRKITEAAQVTKILDNNNEKREMGGLLEVMEKFNMKEGLIITDNQKEERKIKGKTIKIIPAWRWLLELE